MKTTHKHLIVAGLLATLGLATVAQTAAPAAGPASAPTTQREGHGRADPAKMQERMARMEQRQAKKQAQLKQKLQISTAQDGAWNSYLAAIKPAPRGPRPDRAEFAKLSTPERIDRMRAVRNARIAEMDKKMDATKTFYAVLAPEQKKVFDEETARFGHGGRHHGGKHHHRG